MNSPYANLNVPTQREQPHQLNPYGLPPPANN